MFITDGTVLTDEFMMSMQPEVWFLKTDTGSIDSIVVKNAMIAIKRCEFLEIIQSFLMFSEICPRGCIDRSRSEPVGCKIRECYTPPVFFITVRQKVALS